MMYMRTIVNPISFGRNKVNPLKVGELLSILQGIGELLSILWCFSMYEIIWKKIVPDLEKFRVWNLQFEIWNWKFDVKALSLCCCVILLEFGALYDWSCCNVGFGAFLKCCIFWSRCNLDNVGGLWNFGIVGNLWCCWMSFGLNFGGIEVMKFWQCW